MTRPSPAADAWAEVGAARDERGLALALVETAQTLVCAFDREGRIAAFNPRCEELTGYTAAEVLGGDARDVVIPPEQRQAFDDVLDEVWETGRGAPRQGHWVARDGTRRAITWANRPLLDEAGEVTYLVCTGLDVTEHERTTAEIVRLAKEQAALRRVATLVAGMAEPETVFEAAAAEAASLFGVRSAATIRFVDGYAVTVGRYEAGGGGGFHVGTRVSLAGSDALTALVARTGAPARIEDYADVRGEAAERMRELGYRAAVAAPVVVGGRTWGAILAASTDEDWLPAGAEHRLGDFAELLALALASAQARSDLTASRARIVEAALAERARLERNLHDGAQQRLVALSLQLRLAQARLRREPEKVGELLVNAADELEHALSELREIARGLHPAVLADRGLAPALDALSARAPFPVELSGVPQGRLAAGVEAAIYYVIAEAVTNAAKHAGSVTAVEVRMSQAAGRVRVEIADDGRGGADMAAGSGIVGLADRAEALGGRLELHSPPGGGTVLAAELPLGTGPDL